MIRLLTAFALFSLTAPLLAATIHVPSDQTTIQSGIDAAAFGDTVMVACGIYYETDIRVHEGVTLTNETRDAACVILDGGDGEDSILYVLGTVWIEGITLRNNGTSAMSGASYGTAYITNCAFEDNVCYHGGAAIRVGEYTSVMFYHLDSCRFSRNSSYTTGGAIQVIRGEAFCTNCTFDNNWSHEPGGAVSCSEGSAMFIQCTFWSNSAPEGTSLALQINSGAGIMQSILAEEGPVPVFCDHSSEVSVWCTNIWSSAWSSWNGCLQPWEGESDNMSSPPKFCDPMNGNFHLGTGSPCAPGNNGCGLWGGYLGAWPVGCSTSVESRTWSQVKALY